MNNEITNQYSSNPWYRQPAMLLVCGVLISTVISGMTMLFVAANGQDPLVVSKQEYQQIRDDFRLTEARNDATAKTEREDN